MANLGVAGSEITSKSGASVSAVSWSSITAATTNLTLANAAWTTTFNQTANTAWLWMNTTVATVSTTNASPLLEVGANYWATGGSSAPDIWSIGSSLTSGLNGVSTLAVGHTGTTGNTQISIPTNSAFISPNGYAANCDLLFGTGNAPGIGTRNANLCLFSYNNLMSFYSGQVGYGVNLDFFVTPNVAWLNTYTATNTSLSVSGYVTTSGIASVYLGNAGSFTGTSSTQIGVMIGPDGQDNTLTWAPTSGSAAFNALQIAPTINQTSTASGSYVALKIAVTETSLKGTANKLIACYTGASAATAQFSVDNNGNVVGARYSGHNGTALAASDYAASSGWGTAPTLTAVRGTDQGATFTVTAKATVGASPTITLTFHDGTWTTVPVVVVCRQDVVAAAAAPGATVTNQWVVTSVSATAVVFTFNGTPVANNVYGLSFIAMGT